MYSIFKFLQFGLKIGCQLPSAVELLSRDLYSLLNLEEKRYGKVKDWAKFTDDLLGNETNLWLVTTSVNSSYRRLQNCLSSEEAQRVLQDNPNWTRAKRSQVDEAGMLVELLLDFNVAKYSKKYGRKQPIKPTKDVRALLCAYGLLKIDQAFRTNMGVEGQLNAVAIAGRLLASAQMLTQWENVNNPTPSQIGRIGSAKRWAALEEIKSDVKQQWENGAWESKAAFIRAVKIDVLARSKEMKSNLVADNIDRTIRKWLVGLTP